jgi:hypothetical protein
MKRADGGSRLPQQQDHEEPNPLRQPGVVIQKGGERYELVAETRGCCRRTSARSDGSAKPVASRA